MSRKDVLLKRTNIKKVTHEHFSSIKLTEVWKSLNIVNYPIQLEPNNMTMNESSRVLRPTSVRLWNQDARSNAAKESFSRNAAKLWNAAPENIKNAKSLNMAKKEIKNHCKRLPI